MPLMPDQLQALLAQMGGAGAPPPDAGGPPMGGPMPMGPDGGGEPADNLTTAIEAVHALMVEEPDARQVSLLGAILNQLTTFQANRQGTKASG